MGKRDMDPQVRARLKVLENYEDLDKLPCIYLWGDPGSGKSFIAELLYRSMDLGEKKRRAHYNEFMLDIH